jgi:pimeloyl-ACP methyl ester carboxylesterase
VARLKGLAAGLTAGVTAGLVGVAYARAVLRRNDSLRRPPVRDPDGQLLPERTFLYSDGEEVSVIDAGEGPTILWVPGADGPKETFRYQLPSFARRYRVVAADLRVRFAEAHDIDRFTDDLSELIDQLKTGPVVLVGQSLGSAIAMRFAVLYPDCIAGLVLTNPVARVSYEHVGLNRVALVPVSRASLRYLPTAAARALARIWSRLGVWIFDASPGSDNVVEYALFTGPRTTRSSISGKRVELLQEIDLPSQLSSIRAPTLVVKGPTDVYVPEEWALAIAEAIPDTRYVTIPGTGHMSHVSMPGAFNQAVDRWLSDVIKPKLAPESEGESTAAEGRSE